MGEPLNNYAAVKAAVHMMTDPALFALSRRHVTVSTVGVVPRILQMPDDMPVSCCRAARAARGSIHREPHSTAWFSMLTAGMVDSDPSVHGETAQIWSS
jgi:NAD(P)-dependent dehydrogenase (short-subunit alcohol dehydrogenase family)